MFTFAQPARVFEPKSFRRWGLVSGERSHKSLATPERSREMRVCKIVDRSATPAGILSPFPAPVPVPIPIHAPATVKASVSALASVSAFWARAFASLARTSRSTSLTCPALAPALFLYRCLRLRRPLIAYAFALPAPAALAPVPPPVPVPSSPLRSRLCPQLRLSLRPCSCSRLRPRPLGLPQLHLDLYPNSLRSSLCSLPCRHQCLRRWSPFAS